MGQRTLEAPETTTPPVEAAQPAEPQMSAPAAAPETVEAELLVEDVSIDGMCGVY